MSVYAMIHKLSKLTIQYKINNTIYNALKLIC